MQQEQHGVHPEDAIEAAIHEGDFDRTVDALRPLSPAERHARRERLQTLGTLIQHSHWEASWYTKAWGVEATEAHYRTYEAAVVACGRPVDLLNGPANQPCLDTATLSCLCKTFGIDEAAWRAGLQVAVDKALDEPHHHIVGVQRLVGAGLIERPQSEAYLIGLISLPRSLHWQTRGGMQHLFAQDPGLHPTLLRLFEVEGTGEHNLAAMDKYCKSADREWKNIFLQGLADGVYTRDQLLDKTLGTLACDWPQFRAGWFSGFHKHLAPTLAELTPRSTRYLGLCQSRIAPTVTLALDALKSLVDAGAVEEAALLAALQPVLTSALKGQVDAALKLLDVAVKRQPSLSAQACLLAVAGLVHESADVQKKLLQRLAAWGMDTASRLALAEYLPGLAAMHRPAAAALMGETAPEAAEAGSLACAAPAPSPAPEAKRLSPLDPQRALAPLDGMDELLDRTAFALENDTALDEFERVAEALVRHAPFSTDIRKRFSPLVKRARKISHEKAVACELARLVVWVMQGERAESWNLVQRKQVSLAEQAKLDAQAYLGLRIDDWIDLAACGAGLSPLSAATHQRGFVAPEVLVTRAAAHLAQGLKASPQEQVQALLRLPCGPHALTPATLDAARALPDTPFTRALRHALGDTVTLSASDPQHADFELERELFFAAARSRAAGGDDPLTLAAYGDLGPDTGAAARFEWTLQVLESPPDAATGAVTRHTYLAAGTQPRRGTPPPYGVARRRFPEPPDTEDFFYGAWHHDHFSGRTETLVLYAASLVPGHLDALFADGACAIGNNLRWAEARWQDNAYLKLLQDPTVPMSLMAHLTLSVALSAKDPGLVALAVDALLQSHADGRLNAALLGALLGELLASPLVMATRYRKSLQAAVRSDAAAPPLVFGLLCDLLGATGDNPPAGLASLLELLLELALTLRRPLPGSTRSSLERMQLGGKGRSLQKALLGGTLP